MGSHERQRESVGDGDRPQERSNSRPRRAARDPSRGPARAVGTAAHGRTGTRPRRPPTDPSGVRRAAMWWIGAHGGAGESTLAALALGSQPAGHAWPMPADRGTPQPRHRRGAHELRRLMAAQRVAREWASGSTSGMVELTGLVLVADAPVAGPRNSASSSSTSRVATRGCGRCRGSRRGGSVSPTQPRCRASTASSSRTSTSLRPSTTERTRDHTMSTLLLLPDLITTTLAATQHAIASAPDAVHHLAPRASPMEPGGSRDWQDKVGRIVGVAKWIASLSRCSPSSPRLSACTARTTARAARCRTASSASASVSRWCPGRRLPSDSSSPSPTRGIAPTRKDHA